MSILQIGRHRHYAVLDLQGYREFRGGVHVLNVRLTVLGKESSSEPIKRHPFVPDRVTSPLKSTSERSRCIFVELALGGDFG